ncbi:hypothetical protein PG993_001098 [Apiospora rasikravindrae]|uniref:Uncharacterized protein n=1 Tax=Apiospora rasikravindrae TaxID=990691 RepID=A0ABR1UAF3_9PEZI
MLRDYRTLLPHGEGDFARSYVQFQETGCPCPGVQLDRFIEGIPFRRSDASHRLYQALCNTPSNIATSAKSKRSFHIKKDARFLENATSTAIPCYGGSLYNHSFPLGFDAMPSRLGRPPSPPPAQPKLHPYSTFETGLPLQFTHPGRAAVTLGQQRQAAPAAACVRGRRPELVYGFCARLRSYHGVVGLSTHLVQRHRDRSAECKLFEVRRVTRVWKHSVEVGRAGDGCDVATWAKLKQVKNDKAS